MSSHNTSGTGLTGRGLTLPTVSAMEASDGTAVLADGHGDETARYAGIVAAAIGCFCLVLRARNGSCLGARPVIMSVAVPVETSTWGKVVFSSRSAVDAVSGRRKWRWRSFTRAVVGSTSTRKASSLAS